MEVPPALIKRQKQHFTTLEGTGILFTYTYSAACQEKDKSALLGIIRGVSAPRKAAQVAFEASAAYNNAALCSQLQCSPSAGAALYALIIISPRSSGS